MYRIKTSRGRQAFEGFSAYNYFGCIAKVGAKSSKKLPTHMTFLGKYPPAKEPIGLHDIIFIYSRQEENRSISESCKWGIRRRFEQGKVIVNHTKFMGYDKDENGNLVINEKQAKVVRRIFSEYLDGKGTNSIAHDLEKEGIPNWNGKVKWYESSIKKMLSNEKYKGEALLQKTYTVDFLSKKRVENNGEVAQYYVEESHPAIIDKEMWEAVQLETDSKI